MVYFYFILCGMLALSVVLFVILLFVVFLIRELLSSFRPTGETANVRNVSELCLC